MQELKFYTNDCITILKKKLNNTNSCSVIDFKLNTIEEIIGYLGEHVYIKIWYKNDNDLREINFFGKFYPRPHLQVDHDLVSGAFCKEIFIYKHLFEKIRNVNIALLDSITLGCFLTKDKYLLVFDDLRSLGYKTLSKHDYLDYNNVVLVLKTIAKLHASSLIYEEKTSKSLRPYFDKYTETFYAQNPSHMGHISYLASVKGLITEFNIFDIKNNEICKEEYKRRTHNICNKIFNLVKPSEKFRNVICHGDLWMTNFMIKYNKEKPIGCVLLDFQLTRYAPPAHDFMGLLYFVTSRKFRKMYLNEFCDIYYKELEMEVSNYGYDLKEMITRQDFDASCEEQKVFATLQTATYYQMIQVKKDYLNEVVKNKKKWNRILYDDRSLIILENCKNDKEYKQKLQDTFENLVELCDNYQE